MIRLLTMTCAVLWFFGPFVQASDDVQALATTAKAERKEDTKAKRVAQSQYLNTGGERKLDILYKNTPEGDLRLDLYYPTGNQSCKAPVVIYTHGGGWAAGSRHGAARASFGDVFRQLVAKGFCVASVDYRLCRKDGSVSLRDCVIDSKDAVRYLSKNSGSLGVDPMRVYVMGGFRRRSHCPDAAAVVARQSAR